MIRRILTLAFVMCAAVGTQAQNPSFKSTYSVDGSQEKEQYRSHTTLEAVSANTSVVYAFGGVKLNLTAVRLNKTAGQSTDSNRMTTCSNSVMLAADASNVVMTNCQINGHATESFGIASEGQGTTISVEEGRIVTTKEKSSAIYSVNNGKIAINDLEIDTHSKLSPAIETGPEGIVEANSIKGNTSGNGSPLLSSKGHVKVTDSRMTAAMASVGHIRENGQIFLERNQLESGRSCGFLIDNGTGGSTAQVTLAGNTISSKEGPFFMVHCNNAEITLTGNSISYNNDCFLNVYGGSAILNLAGQNISGDIETDSISAVTVNLSDKSALSAAINSGNNPQAQISICIGSKSKWNVKGESFISSVTFENGIDKGLKQISGKYKVHYNAADPKNAALESKEYKLSGGGTLTPQ